MKQYILLIDGRVINTHNDAYDDYVYENDKHDFLCGETELLAWDDEGNPKSEWQYEDLGYILGEFDTEDEADAYWEKHREEY